MRLSEPLIWWTSEEDCRRIKAMFYRLSAGWSEDNGSPTWPPYIADQYSGRYGRSGRGRLWVAPQFVGTAVVPWPITPLSEVLSELCAGIVIDPEDLWHVGDLPGLVTDLSLNPIRRTEEGAPTGYGSNYDARVEATFNLVTKILDAEREATSADRLAAWIARRNHENWI